MSGWSLLGNKVNRNIFSLSAASPVPRIHLLNAPRKFLFCQTENCALPRELLVASTATKHIASQVQNLANSDMQLTAHWAKELFREIYQAVQVSIYGMCPQWLLPEPSVCSNKDDKTWGSKHMLWTMLWAAHSYPGWWPCINQLSRAHSCAKEFHMKTTHRNRAGFQKKQV